MKIMIDITNEAIIKEMAEAYVKHHLGYGVNLEDIEFCGNHVKGTITKNDVAS